MKRRGVNRKTVFETCKKVDRMKDIKDMKLKEKKIEKRNKVCE